jgi:Tfp pilus assembly protein PilW
MRVENKRQWLFIRSHGLTLVELLIAAALSLVVITVALLALAGMSRGLQSTSGTAQLNDAVMLVNSVMQRSAAQAGYQLSSSKLFTRETYYSAFNKRPYPDVYGRNATQMAASAASISAGDVTAFYAGGGSGGLSTSANASGNDLLAIRFQVVPEGNKEESGLTAMIDLCTGQPLTTDPYSIHSIMDASEMHKPVYTFFVVDDVLYCKSWVNAAGSSNAVATAVMDGVVAFKVLYGVYGGSDVAGALGAPNQWKYASSMNAQEWYQVKRIRIGLLLRSRTNVGPAHNTTVDYYPLGEEFFSSGNPGSKVTVNYADGCVYRAANFTVNISNLLIPRNE